MPARNKHANPIYSRAKARKRVCHEGPNRDRGSNPVPGYQQRHESLGALQVALPAPLAAAFKLLTATGRVAGWLAPGERPKSMPTWPDLSTGRWLPTAQVVTARPKVVDARPDSAPISAASTYLPCPGLDGDGSLAPSNLPGNEHGYRALKCYEHAQAADTPMTPISPLCYDSDTAASLKATRALYMLFFFKPPTRAGMEASPPPTPLSMSDPCSFSYCCFFAPRSFHPTLLPLVENSVWLFTNTHPSASRDQRPRLIPSRQRRLLLLARPGSLLEGALLLR